MPRLSRIRISGNKYDGLQKRHENSIFDLNTGGRGNHSLFTLQNGSGKGVMLQLIFQIMLPGTAWGSNNGNKLEGMFYDRYNVFRPYTFHVVQEWNLDSQDDRKLLAGICVSAHRQNSTADSDDRVGLSYFLYTHEYKGASRFSLENLPLYSKTKGGAISYEELEAFIDENKQDLVKYSKSSVQRLNSDYYQYLASHGIYRSEWEIMKTINRSEGGLERYFSQARDNQALFDKLIIPAISESISYHSMEKEESLVSMFIDNIKIARDLPELISRTDDINQLLQLIIPLLTDGEHGIKLKNTALMIRERGKNYLRALQTREAFLQNELQRSKEEKNKTNVIIQELGYEEANLKYARKLRKLNELKEKREKLSKELGVLEESLLKLEEEEKLLRLNQHYLLYQELQKDFLANKEQIEILQKTAGLSNLREEINTTKENIIKYWPELKKELEESSKDISAYINYLNTTEKTLKQRQENLERSIREKERLMDQYKAEKERLAQWQNRLLERFNPLQLSIPAYLLEELSTGLEKRTDELNRLRDKEKEISAELKQLQEEINEIRIEKLSQENKYEELERIYRERKREEEELWSQLIKLLELDKFKEVYNQDWLLEKRTKLNVLLEEKMNGLQDLNNKGHELELDLSLNNKEYWIANQDQRRLYQLIARLDIKVYYGSDFLLNLVEDKEELLQRYPLLPYGLVLLYEADWKKVKGNLSKEELYRSPVPIYINHKLETGKEQVSFKLVGGKEQDFILSNALYKKWRDNIENQLQEIRETGEVLARKIDNIRRVDYAAELLLEKKASEELADELDLLKEGLTEKEAELKNTQVRQEELEIERERLEKKIIDLEATRDSLEADYQEIKVFAEESERLARREEELIEVKEELGKLEESLSRNSKDRDENRKLQLKIENEQENWLKDLRVFLAELQEIIPEPEFAEKELEKEEQNYPLLYDYRDSRVNYFYQNLLALEREEETRSGELKYLRKEQESLRERILEEEERLEAIDKGWKNYSYDILSKEELKIGLERVREEIQEKKRVLTRFMKELNILTGELRSTQKQVDEIFKEINDRFHKTPRSWLELDLDQKELRIKEGLEENQKYLLELEDMIEDYLEKISQLNKLINKLEFYQLDAEKGELNSRLEEMVRSSPFDLVEEWVKDYQDIERKLKELKEKTEDDLYTFKRNVNEMIKNDLLRIKINEKIIQDFRSDNYSFNYEMLSSFREYLLNELNSLDDNKAEAERARNQWAERSAMHVIRIITSLKEMINNMVFHNQKGYAFPLVRLRRSDLLPELEEEIIPELKEYFVELIERFKKEAIDIDRLSESQLKEYTGDAALFSRAVRGNYPVLQVYKMTEKNEFQYAKPQDYFYADWEAVIQGKGDTPEGSGGQTLSINAFMMMMLLNYRKQGFDKRNPWTVLFLDNPFGKASAAHVLDPIFEIANKLNFQIIAFAAPEIIKTEISERFPVFYPLEISSDEKGAGVVKIAGQVIYGERKRRT